jgi:putative component of membrane protein insertase Oxa1/YidC/SpoIIIJ protein YidD
MESNCSNRVHVNGFLLSYCDHNLLCSYYQSDSLERHPHYKGQR